MCEEDQEIDLGNVELKVSLWHPDRIVQEEAEDVTATCAIYYYLLQDIQVYFYFWFYLS